jgi:hypothetical protein
MIGGSDDRIQAALAGALGVDKLSVEEGVAYNAEVSASIERYLATADWAKMHADAGIATVAIDDVGDLVEYAPDGTKRILGAQ